MAKTFTPAPYVSDGILQSWRLLKSPLPKGIAIDDQQIQDFMNFVMNFSTLVKYYNESNKVEGAWDVFFKSEYPFQLAFISSVSLTEENVNLQILGNNLEPGATISESDKNITAQLVFAGIIKIARRLDAWYVDIHEGSQNTRLTLELSSAIENSLKLALNELKVLGKILFGDNYEREAGYTFEGFAAIWQLSDTSDIRKGLNNLQVYDNLADEKNENRHPADANRERLAEILWIFTRTQSYIIAVAKAELESFFVKGPPLKPHLALLLAYWEMYKHPQALINNFAQKHLDFYYKEVLNLKKKAATADNVFVCFELAKGITDVAIPAGTQLDAGKDENGSPVVFATDKSIVVNQIIVSKLRCLYFARIEQNKTNLVSNIFSAQIATADVAALPKGWPPFGYDESSEPVSQQLMTTQPTGFAIASPVLLLQEGDRKITICIHLSPASVALMQTFLKSYMGVTALAAADFVPWFANAFVVSASGPKGWISCKSPSCTYDDSKGVITMGINLGLADQPLVNYNSAVLGNSFNTGLPLLQFVLNNDNPHFPYSLFSTLIIQSIVICVKVSGLQNLSLYNINGKIDATKPFQPFGPAPAVNAYLAMGSNEFANKNLTSLTVNMDWFNLPAAGFADYYSGYTNVTPPIANDSFRAKISWPSTNKWVQPADGQPDFNLFNPGPNTNKKSQSVLSGPIVLDKAAADAGNLVFDENNKNGFFTIELTRPDHGFLNDLYAQQVNSVMLHNAGQLILQAKNHDTKKTADTFENYPNMPFTPVLKTITVDYEADMTADVFLGSGQLEFFYVDFFNTYRAYPPATKPALGLPVFPVYNDQAYCYIGLQNVQLPETAAILVQVNLKPAIDNLPETPAINWQYLSDAGWLDFSVKDKPVDRTAQLSQTNVIEFSLPAGMILQNDAQGGAYWIRGSLVSYSPLVCNIDSISAQAVSATRLMPVNAGDAPAVLKPIPAGGITGFVNSLPAVKKIIQTVASFGGTNGDTDNSFYLRIAERLNHKQRAVTSWDYERLLLQQYPNLYYVRCLNHTAALKSGISPGNVTVVVIPGLDDTAFQVNASAPRLPYDQLTAMRDFLAGCASPAATISVVNPTYIFLKINCKVTFQAGLDASHYLKTLNGALCNFLSPWIDNGISYNIKGKLTGFNILSFIERCDYVDGAVLTSITLSEEKENGYYRFFKTLPFDQDNSNLYDNIIDENKPWTVLASRDNHGLTV